MSTTLKFALLLFAAAVLALGARALFANMADQQPRPDQTAQIRIAASELPAGLLLREDDLDWKSVEKAQSARGCPGAGYARSREYGG